MCFATVKSLLMLLHISAQTPDDKASVAGLKDCLQSAYANTGWFINLLTTAVNAFCCDESQIKVDPFKHWFQPF